MPSAVARMVLDTNVLVSALLTPQGAPAAVLEGVLEGRWESLVSPDILREYESVLARPEFGLRPGNAHLALSRLSLAASWVHPAISVRACSDPDDDKFLACALEGAATHLVTGNIKHFPRNTFQGIQILSPRGFLDSNPR